MKDINMDSFRLSIAWPRVIPCKYITVSGTSCLCTFIAVPRRYISLVDFLKFVKQMVKGREELVKKGLSFTMML